MDKISKDQGFKMPDIDLAPLDNFEIEELASWSQLKLRYAITGHDIDFNVFMFCLSGIVIDQNMKDIMMNAIELNEEPLMNDVRTIEVLVSIFNESSSYWSSPVLCKWVSMKKHDICMGDFSKKTMFRFLKAIDKNYPFLLIQYYDKHKRLVQMKDKDLCSFIYQLTDKKAQKNDVFKKIYDIMLKDREKYQKLNMFMS